MALYPPPPSPVPSASQASSNSNPFPTTPGLLSGAEVRAGVGGEGGVRGGAGIEGGTGGWGGASPAASSVPFDLRLIDLGNAVFAADTVPGVTAGTPSYLSPEAREGRAWGPAVDVWAAGCILHEVVTGDRGGAAGSIYRGGGGGGGSGVGADGGGGVGMIGDDRSLGSGMGVAGGAGVGAGTDRGVVAGVVAVVRRLLTEDVNARPTAEEALKDAVFTRG